MNPKHLSIALSLVALAACSKQPSEAQSSPSASAVALSDEALDQAPVPVKEDFEDQARQSVTAENLDEQLDQLEKQITEDR